jgi:hypothetical protein
MTASEQALLTSAAAQGAASKLATRIADSVAAFRSAFAAIEAPLGPDGTVPDAYRNHAMAYAVGEWLRDYPALKAFYTDQRKDAYKAASDMLTKVALRQCGAIEPPCDVRTANWGSDNRVLGRMAFPPPPALQFQPLGSQWPENANPNATSMTVQVQVPEAPKNLTATALNQPAGVLVLTWGVPIAATSFKVWRGTASGAEALIASGVTTNVYKDTYLTSGTTYYYYVVGVNEVGVGAKSVETTGVPN